MAELIPVLIIIALLALNALFVAAEFAIVGVPRTSIERRAQQGSRVARIVSAVLADPRRQDRFDLFAQPPCQNGRRATGRDRDHDIPAVDDRRKDECREVRTIHDVDGNILLARERGDAFVDFFSCG